MKRYKATVMIPYYVTVEVDADNEALAVDEALAEANSQWKRALGSWGDEPLVTELMTVVEEEA